MHDKIINMCSSGKKTVGVLVWASGLDGWREMDSFHAEIASSYSSGVISRVKSVYWPREIEGQTEMVMGYAKVEEGASVFLDICAAFIEFLRCLDVALFEFSGALLQTAYSLCFCWVRCGGVRCYRSGPSWKIRV